MTDLVMGVDVGGTTVKAALLDSDWRDYGRCEQPTPRDEGPDAVVSTMIDTVVELRNHVPEAGRLRAVGLVVPGVVDAQHGIAVYATNIGWRDLPIRQIVSEAVGLPVILDHDVRAAGLAELELGAGRGALEMLFVALGTGIAAAVITRGRLEPVQLGWPVNLAICRSSPTENGAPAGNADVPKPMPAEPPSPAVTPPSAESAASLPAM